MDLDEDRLRAALAFLRAVATDDAEGATALTNTTNLHDLAADLAQIGLLFIEYVSDNPAAHVDRMFHALTVTAVERFERSTPAPQFEGRPSARSWLGEAVDRMRSAVQ